MSTPNTTPMATPRAAPSSEITIDSSRIIRRSWDRLSPIARSRPTSRVRSMIESARVLTMPRTAMISASPSSAKMISRNWSIERAALLGELLLVEHGHDRQLLDHVVQAVLDPGGAVLLVDDQRVVGRLEAGRVERRERRDGAGEDDRGVLDDADDLPRLLALGHLRRRGRRRPRGPPRRRRTPGPAPSGPASPRCPRGPSAPAARRPRGRARWRRTGRRRRAGTGSASGRPRPRPRRRPSRRRWRC